MTLVKAADIMPSMKNGTIVEYIDQQKIICAVVMDIKNKRLRLLTESDKEVNLTEGRLSFTSVTTIDITSGRGVIVSKLKEIAERREQLKASIDLKELWELLNEEPEWVDLPTMAEYCFPAPPESDQQAAVIRACFENRSYFKFAHDKFLPYTEEQVEAAFLKKEKEARRQALIGQGAEWLKKAVSEAKPALPKELTEIPEILKSALIHEKESPHFKTCKEILTAAGVSLGNSIFNLLVQLGEFDENANLDLYRLQIPMSFSSDVLERAREIKDSVTGITAYPDKEDYTHISAITIDGQSTTDYDDALSIEKIGDSYILGIHISDVSYFVEKGDLLDRKAQVRAASIYTPDMKIPMFPKELSENAASLVEGELRPCISVIVTLNRFGEIKDYEIASTQVRVERRLTYAEANSLSATDDDLKRLIKIAQAFREKRLKAGATQINLPEVNPFFDDDGQLELSIVDRETPPRMMVAEMMIMANWLMAGFIARHDLPGVFRAQPEPKERLYKGESESLFLNCLQRKFVSRAIISSKASHHAGLGVDAYTTATSPIRRYYDLLSQRQIKAALGKGEAYSTNELTRLIQILEVPMSNVGRVQFTRKRFWTLKYLETKVGTRTSAIVLNKRRNSYSIMLTEFMLEYFLPAAGLNLKPGDLLSVVIQHANPRKDSFSVYIG